MHRTIEQTQFARRLRRKATYAERILWILLRDRDLGRFKFRRQHPVGPYFADFACVTDRLIVECDGITHDERQAQDAARDLWFLQKGWRVLRFSDERVIGNPDRVAAEILAVLNTLPASIPII